MGTFSLKHHYATVIFDFGADFSFISTSFTPLLNVKSNFVNPRYLIEVAYGKKVEVDRVIRAGILTDEAVSCGTLTKGNEKRKGVEESSKQAGGRNENKRAKVSKGFVASTNYRNENDSGCVENQKVKYAASSFVNKALTWWNTQVQARGREAVIGMSWVDFKALLVEEFCPSNEVEKLESEFWNHKIVGANHAGYTNRFHELAKLVSHLVNPESSRIKRYIAGLALEIQELGYLLMRQLAVVH
nr:reverse transcriptase domain-containing protein [Tanacetum cinerariifolium]